MNLEEIKRRQEQINENLRLFLKENTALVDYILGINPEEPINNKLEEIGEGLLAKIQQEQESTVYLLNLLYSNHERLQLSTFSSVEVVEPMDCAAKE